MSIGAVPSGPRAALRVVVMEPAWFRLGQQLGVLLASRLWRFSGCVARICPISQLDMSSADYRDGITGDSATSSKSMLYFMSTGREISNSCGLNYRQHKCISYTYMSFLLLAIGPLTHSKRAKKQEILKRGNVIQ